MYDIAIIGAGPAGAILARELKRRLPDFKIAIADGLSEGQSKVCGGLLSPDAKKELSSLGIEIPDSIRVSPKSPYVDTIDLTAGIKRRYERDYINTDRYAFDRYLLSLASGVDIFRGRCVKVERAECGFVCRVSEKGGTTEIKSRLIAGADGAFSIVRRSLFPDRRIYRYTAVQEWYEDFDGSLPAYSCIYDETTSDSCSWTIRKDGFYIFGGAFKTDGCKAAFESQKARLEEFFGSKFPSPVRREACLVCCPKKKEEIFLGGDGAYLLGEAAGLISASSFEGISSAIRSGSLLAEAIAEGGSNEEITRSYKKKTRKLRLKIALKIPKMRILTTPTLRKLIMKSGITAKKER